MFCRFVHSVSLALKSPYGEQSIKYVFFSFLFFASDVALAMLEGKNYELSLCWEMNFIIMYWHLTWPPCHVGANQELVLFYCSRKSVCKVKMKIAPSSMKRTP